MKTLREAFSDPTANIFTAIKTKDPSKWIFQTTPKTLDILLISKYGKRRINALTEMFANNQGVVQDINSLSDVVSEMYMDQWTKSWEALNLEYDINSPYHITKEIDQTDARSIAETVDKDVAKTASDEKDSTNTSTDSLETSKSKNETVTDSGRDTVTISNTNSIDSTSRDSGTDTTSSTSTTNDETTSTDSGSDQRSSSTNETESGTTSLNLSGNPDLGETHQVTSNRADTKSEEASASMGSMAPYDSENMKDVSKSLDKSLGATNSNETLSEKTLDKSQTVVDNTDDITTDETTTYGKSNTTELDSTTTESSSIVHGKVTTVDHDETQSGTETTAYGKVETTGNTESIETSENGSNTLHSEGSSTESEATDISTTTTDNLSSNVQETEIGNKWTSTNQEMIEQELELRKHNLNERMLKDVANLLTITIYSQEE